MKYIVVTFVFLNTIILANLIKTAVLYALLKVEKSRKIPIIKIKKKLTKTNLQYLKNKKFKNAINNQNKNKLKFTKNKYKSPLKINKNNKKIYFQNKNLEFNLYSESKNYFLKNIKIIISTNNKTEIIKNKRYNEFSINNQVFLTKTSIYQNKQINVLIFPILNSNKTSKQNKSQNNYSVKVISDVNVLEPVLYIKKQKNKYMVEYKNNTLKVCFKTIKTNSNFGYKNQKHKSRIKVNKQQSVILFSSTQSNNLKYTITISSNEFMVLCKNRTLPQQQKITPQKRLNNSLYENRKYIFLNKNLTYSNKNTDQSKNNLNRINLQKQVLFNYYIHTNNKKINYLVNSFLPNMVIKEYVQQKDKLLLSEFIKSKNRKELKNYSYNKTIKWLLAKRDYTTLYSYLLNCVLGVVFDYNTVYFVNSNLFFGKIAVKYLDEKIIKYNNINGFYYIYNGIIYNNVPTLQLKNKELPNANIVKYI